MIQNFRFVSIFALAALAAASQAVVFSFVGTSSAVAASPTSFTSTAVAVGPVTPFSLITSGLVTLNGGAGSTVVFSTISPSSPAGTGTLTVTFDGTTDNTATSTQSISALGTITAGTGAFLQYVSPTNTVTVTSNTNILGSFNVFSVQGNVSPVPEPSAFAALGLGAVALVRRRRKA